MKDTGSDERIERVLGERAQRLANVKSVEKPRQLLFQIAVLLVGKNQIGIAVNSLREVQPVVPITPLPGLPEGMLGIAQVRGEVLCVVDLSRWIGTEDRGAGGCLAVIEGRRGPLGLIADHCAGFRDVHHDDIVHDGGAGQTAPLRYVHKVTRDCCAILDVQQLLDDPRLVVGAPRARNAESLS